jgi:hypothetical protein
MWEGPECPDYGGTVSFAEATAHQEGRARFSAVADRLYSQITPAAPLVLLTREFSRALSLPRIS